MMELCRVGLYLYIKEDIIMVESAINKDLLEGTHAK